MDGYWYHQLRVGLFRRVSRQKRGGRMMSSSLDLLRLKVPGDGDQQQEHSSRDRDFLFQ